jgi:multidrug efflux pump subunit AcrB
MLLERSLGECGGPPTPVLVLFLAAAAKNAVLIVEFAAEQHREGKSALDAAIEAARLRFRPIVMTSLAFILGVVPLAISAGAGSASRHSVGTGVIGGMASATFLATLFVSLFFRLVTRTRAKTEAAALPATQEPGLSPGE